MEFKGTKEKLEPKYVSGICIGIGTIGQMSKMTANSILNHIETYDDYEKEKVEIEADMLLYSKASEMLDSLKEMCYLWEAISKSLRTIINEEAYLKAKQLIKEAPEMLEMLKIILEGKCDIPKWKKEMANILIKSATEIHN